MSSVSNMTARLAGSDNSFRFTVRDAAAAAAAIRRHFRQEDPRTGQSFVKGPLTIVLAMGGDSRTVVLSGKAGHQEDILARAIMSMNTPSFDPASLKSIEVGDIGEMRA